LRKGYVRVAGVTTEEVRAELLWMALDRGITMSKAVGVALQEWLHARRGGVSHLGDIPQEAAGAGQLSCGLHPVRASREGSE